MMACFPLALLKCVSQEFAGIVCLWVKIGTRTLSARVFVDHSVKFRLRRIRNTHTENEKIPPAHRERLYKTFTYLTIVMQPGLYQLFVNSYFTMVIDPADISAFLRVRNLKRLKIIHLKCFTSK